ncbi:hypothetical protein ACFRQM_00720 [Streptomyces sp. NPDC056831]|uniref:hypothetical protein n=1 Tax=Streptomyces sp. NPDC056831 TaxID=3345954 RepID=UPI0036CA8724
MAFNAAQYEATMQKLSSGTQKLETKLNEIGPKAESTANKWYVPDFLGDALIWTANKIIEIGSWILNKIKEFLRGAVAPIRMYNFANDWEGESVRGAASGVAGNTAPEALKAPKHWKGAGADAYTGAVKGQPTAATQIETSADKIAGALTLSAAAGLLFYLALAVILAKFFVALLFAIASVSTVVFSWAGAATIVEEAGVNTALVIAAVTALAGALTIQKNQMAVIEGEAHDNSTFPQGKWPTATA